MKISSTKLAEISKSEFKNNKEELKRLIREEEEREIENQDNKERKNNQLLQLNNNQLLALLPLNKNQLKRKDNQEEEDQDKVNNDLFVYEFKIL